MTTESTTDPFAGETLTDGEGTTMGGGSTGGRDPRAIASDIAAQAPAAVNSAVDAAAGAITESATRIQSSSDEVLAIGTALSTGIAIGLILGGAPRLLIGAALIPTAAMGFTLLSRYTEVRPKTGTAAAARRGA
jgi:hypothetical protein